MDNQFEKYSDQKAHRVAYLVAGYIRGTISKKEHEELDEWICESDENMQLFERLTDEKNLEEAAKWMETVNTEKALEERKQQIQFNKPPVRKLWARLLPYAAAALVVIIGSLIIFKPFGRKKDTPAIVEIKPADILPGTNKATLHLEDGKTVVLSDRANDTTIDGQIKILEQGEIVYSETTTNNPMAYHTLTIPRKGQYKLILPDGTKVWMNAESSIRFPVAFNGNERKVFVSGEAYFEVAKDKTKPFRVVINLGSPADKDIIVEALGTAFNINAYANEPFVRTTLIEGSILVSKEATENILRPGQQAKINGTDFEIENVEPGNVTAWKNNLFNFVDAPLDEIMRQIERWYDAEVVYEAKPTDHFNAIDVPRDVPVSKLLYYLEKTNRVHFKIENKKITVIK